MQSFHFDAAFSLYLYVPPTTQILMYIGSKYLFSVSLIINNCHQYQLLPNKWVHAYLKCILSHQGVLTQSM